MSEVWGFATMFGAIAAVIVAIASCTAIVDPKIAASKAAAFTSCVNAGQEADKCRFAFSYSSK